MALTTVDFTQTFKVDEKDTFLTDTTDYAGQGLALADYEGKIDITDPTGSIINTGVFGDIDPDVSLISADFALNTLAGSGLIVPGNYVVTYTVREIATPANQVAQEKTFDFSYLSPEVDLDMTVDCIIPQLTSTDNTPYTVDGVSPTTIVRDHRIQYPPSTNQADVAGVGPVIQTSTVFTIKGQALQHSADLVSTITYDIATDYVVTDIITGNGFIQVTCDAELCDVYCCLKSQWNRYQTQLGVNKSAAANELGVLTEMLDNASLLKIAIDCGKTTDISGFSAEINRLGNCTEGCDCDDGTPQLVTGLGVGSGGIVVVDSGGTPVVVTSVTVGDTTTYTVSLAAAFVTKANASIVGDVLAGTDISVSSTLDSNGNKVSTINSTAAAAVTPDLASVIVDFDTSNSGSLPVITITQKKDYGTYLDADTLVVTNESTPAATWQSNNSCFKVDTYQADATRQAKMLVDVIGVTYTGSVAENCSSIRNLFVQVHSTTVNDEFKFRFIDGAGVPVTGNQIEADFDNIKIAIVLKA